MLNKHNSSRDCIKLDRDCICPMCRNGNISVVFLMQEAFTCNSCSHIFTRDRNWQILKSIALQIPILWRCHGKQWQVIKKIDKSESTYSGLFCR